jgi:two-component system cell cycle response regulator DivK
MRSARAVAVDDDPKSLRVLVEALALLGISCTTIQDPTIVINTLGTIEDVDVVFVDLEMPELDGFTLLKILKEDLSIESPIVAHSVHTNEVNHARQLGFDGFLGKPLRLNQFHDQLDRILSGEGVWDVD